MRTGTRSPWRALVLITALIGAASVYRPSMRPAVAYDRYASRAPTSRPIFAQPTRPAWPSPALARPTSVAASGLQYITLGPDGNLWFTAYNGNRVGRLTPRGTATLFALPSARSVPDAIVRGADGGVWFTESGANRIGRLSPTGHLIEFAIPEPYSLPFDLTRGPDGALWFTAAGGDGIGRVSVTGRITVFHLPTLGSDPDGITMGADHALWFTEYRRDWIGRITVRGVVTEFPICCTQAPKPQGSWAPTGHMLNARYGHTATLLPTGNVLVVGGDRDSYHALDSAELYDPRRGAWTPTRRIPSAGASTATLLTDGRVLVISVLVKGTPSGMNSITSHAALYDPRMDRWTPTAPMRQARTDYTATRLPNGSILVAGGEDKNSHPLASAELYDPRRGRWSIARHMSAARTGHTATLLRTGKVLVAGGNDPPLFNLYSAELYDPRGGTWTPTGVMHTLRTGHTATLLPDGKVLVAGGVNQDDGFLSSAEVYDPRTGWWTPTGQMGIARQGHAATLLPTGKVLVVGGSICCAPFRVLTSAEIYDPHRSAWADAGHMSVARENATATLLPDGKALIAGGSNSLDLSSEPRALSSAELYNPRGDR